MHQVESFVKVLKRFKGSMGWTMAHIIWIPQGICTHNIQLKHNHVPCIEHQRNLNPPKIEEVKTKIIKWLHTRVIYPIGDSSWVCPV